MDEAGVGLELFPTNEPGPADALALCICESHEMIYKSLFFQKAVK